FPAPASSCKAARPGSSATSSRRRSRNGAASSSRRASSRSEGRMSALERNPEPKNPRGIDGIEFIEYTTSQAQAFGALLQKMGFAADARHRSREVMLYRQGSMNL